MSQSTQNHKSAKNSRRTKVELEVLFGEAEIEQKKTVERLRQCQKSAEELQARLKKDEADFQNELKSTLKKTKELEAALSEKQTAFENEGKNRDALKKENARLNETMETNKNGYKKLLREKRDLEKQVCELQRRNLALEETELFSEDDAPGASASKTSFRVDLYVQDDQYLGKIEHLLSNRKKSFQWNKSDEMIAFMVSFLSAPSGKEKLQAAEISDEQPMLAPSAPQAPANEQIEDLDSVTSRADSSPEPEEATSPNEAADAASSRKPGLDSFIELPVKLAFKPRHIIAPGDPLSVRISFVSDELNQFMTEKYKCLAWVYTTSLTKPGWSRVLSSEQVIDLGRPLELEAPSRGLEPGAYRLKATLNLRAASENQRQVSVQPVSGIFHVC